MTDNNQNFCSIRTFSASIDFLGNWRSAVLRRIFCAVKSVSSAALLGVMQGRDTKPGAKETSKTVLRKFSRKSIDLSSFDHDPTVWKTKADC